MRTSTTRRRLVCAAAAATLVALGVAGCARGRRHGERGRGRHDAELDTSGGGGTVDRREGPAAAPGTVADSDRRTPSGTPSSTTGRSSAPARCGSAPTRSRGRRWRRPRPPAPSGASCPGEQTVTDPSDPDRTVAELTLRVPSNRFDDLLVKVRGLGTVLEQTQQAQDVTGQVADVDARVEAQRASVRRIQALLARANTIGEVVTVEGQLAQRQADLESLEAQQKALKDQTALATLEVSVVGPDPVGTQDDPTGFLAGLAPRVDRLHVGADRRAHGLRRGAPLRRVRAADPAARARLAALADPSGSGPAGGAVRAAGPRGPAGRLTGRSTVRPPGGRRTPRGPGRRAGSARPGRWPA